MAVWTVSVVDEVCRACDGVIPPNQPIALLTSMKLMRCQSCAERSGLSVDEAQVDAARHRLEAARAAADQAPLTVSQFASRSNVTRVARRRPMKSAAEIAKDLPFDSKRAAAGE